MDLLVLQEVLLLHEALLTLRAAVGPLACVDACIGEGNGNPLQYSCLENPRDGGAWWAAVYGVAESQT